jgi:putative nucleotidyltransferase with HDIG domain
MSKHRVVWILLLTPWVGGSQSTSGAARTHEDAMTQALVTEMKAYFAENQGLIDHTLAVYGYAEQIRKREGGDALTVRGAALYHDIGIPEARRVHGSAAGKFQEKEGPPIARGILSGLHLDRARADFICRIIANHHTAHEGETTSTIEFKIIWDADALVNLRRKQGKIDEETFRRLIHNTFRTETGLKRAEALFLPDKPKPTNRPRLIVLTDFFKDPDDKQSLIRLLVYANELDIEGLLATSLAYGNGAVHPEWIQELIGLYDKVLPKLRQHVRPGTVYPPAASLADVVKAGAPVIRSYVGRSKGFPVPYPPGAHDNRRCGPAEQWIGLDRDTPASEHIIAIVDRDDPRPVWVSVWGGAMDLAQALWKVRHERTTAETDRFVSKLRVYQISWQDTASAGPGRTSPSCS